MDGGRRNAQNEDNQQTDLLCQDSDDNLNDNDDEDNQQNDLIYKFLSYYSIAMMMAMRLN